MLKSRNKSLSAGYGASALSFCETKVKPKSSSSSRTTICLLFFVNNNKMIDKMATVRCLLLVSVIALTSFATSDVTVQNVKCEMACALKYNQVSVPVILV